MLVVSKKLKKSTVVYGKECSVSPPFERTEGGMD
jgi:hypothetical protein